jgi:hypothetical protein
MPPAHPNPLVDGPKTQGGVEFSAHQQRRDGEIARTCHGQHGLITLEQLKARGLTVQAVHERLMAGRLHRIHQRVYSLTPGVMTVRGKFMAAVLACGTGAVISHRSAAYLWGLVDAWEEPIDVTASNRRGRSPAGVAAHRDGSLQPVDKTRVHGVPCTSLARTLLDFAGRAPDRELRKVVAQAEVLGVLDLEAIRSVLRRGRLPLARRPLDRGSRQSPVPRHGLGLRVRPKARTALRTRRLARVSLHLGTGRTRTAPRGRYGPRRPRAGPTPGSRHKPMTPPR